MKKKKQVEVIDVSVDKIEGLKYRLTSGSLLEEDKPIILAIISAYVWIQGQLEAAKLNIYRLKALFGFSTEKRKKSGEKRKNSDLKLDLNSLGTLNYKEGSSNELQTQVEEESTKK